MFRRMSFGAHQSPRREAGNSVLKTVLLWHGGVDMTYRRDLWEIAASHNSVVTVAEAEDAGVPAVEVRKLASRGALTAFGHGVYTHRDVLGTPATQPALAVALAGEGAFLQRESVFDLLGMGQFNPPKVCVGTGRRVRRRLPEWMDLEYRPDVLDADLTNFEGIPMTTVGRALRDMRQRMPPDRWSTLADEALSRGLVGERGIVEWKENVA